MPNPPLSLPAFKSWLSASPNLVVGQTRLPCDCPISNFLSSLGLTGVKVKTAYFSYHAEESTEERTRTVALPPWAIAFISAIDEEDRGKLLTGQFCLSILADLPEGQSQ